MPRASTPMITSGSSWRFQTVNAPCSTSTPYPCGLSSRPRKSASATSRPSIDTVPRRTAASATIRTCPLVRTLHRVRVPRSSTAVVLPMATSWGGQSISMSSSRLSALSTRPLAPKMSLPPTSRIPGGSLMLGIPSSAPTTRMSARPSSSAPSSSAGVATVNSPTSFSSQRNPRPSVGSTQTSMTEPSGFDLMVQVPPERKDRAVANESSMNCV
jgi:hypothetical protein